MSHVFVSLSVSLFAHLNSYLSNLLKDIHQFGQDDGLWPSIDACFDPFFSDDHDDPSPFYSIIYNIAVVNFVVSKHLFD